MPPEPYAAILARNLREARAALDPKPSQAMVGKQMNEQLGFTGWQPSTMSLVERNKRRVTGEELFALAHVLRTSVVRLMSPAEEDHEVAFPSGKSVSAGDAIARVRGGAIARAGVATATAMFPQPTVRTNNGTA